MDNRKLPNPVRRISKKKQQEIDDRLKADLIASLQNEVSGDSAANTLMGETSVSAEETKVPVNGSDIAPSAAADTTAISSSNSAPMLLFDEEVISSY